jgi:hypothetical protein
MVEALIAAERDPLVLAGLAKGKLRAKLPRGMAEGLAAFFERHPLSALS